MSDVMRRLLLGILVTAGAAVASAEPPAAPAEAAWSEASNGLRARLSARRTSVSNGTGIVTTYLELENLGEIANPLRVAGATFAFRVTDEDGREVPRSGLAFDGPGVGALELSLPHDATLRYPIGPTGAGIPADQAALLDLGPGDSWALPKDGKRYFLQGVMEASRFQLDVRESGILWHGRIELPRVPVPTESDPIDPARLGPLIDDLGAKMLAADGRRAERASRELSMIDDPRVVAWYVKAVRTRSYELKFGALDRLARLEGDDALAGLEIGMKTGADDIANCTTTAVASSMAENIRHSAALGLARSPHPRAKALLWTMEKDPATSVRITVVQAAGRADTPESLALLERAALDQDATVRREAGRLLQARREGAPK